MATSYPGAVDNFTNPTTSDPMNSATVPHASQHANVNDAIEAVQTTLGTNPQGTAASVKARLDTLEGVIDDRLPGEANSTAPTGPFPTGYVWSDATNHAIKVWDGTQFVDPSNAGGGTGLPWAVVSGGTVTEYTHPVHGVMEVHTFLGNGNLVVATEGYADVFLISGGGYASGTFTGAGGRVRDGLWNLPAGTLACVVGAGVGGYLGAASSVGSLTSGVSPGWFGGAGGTSTGGGTAPSDTGYTSSVTGSPVVYGRGNVASPTANRGDGSATSGAAGSSGIVIVAVKKP